ncbi:histidine kinase [Kitasatospora sp. GP82]|uniref:sensor histidine kinase n=1 Tax=Kitasatospora sp. GP82 TaxID=3035089 RepID=UPI0024753B21|nr:histidine kinase [Kitasatospora sp. GP82]MDH6123885.1 signal transduction histidine kinase [Kitasatospora sp. GP82]
MSALIGRRAALRWVHLVLGGALLMPYWLLSSVLLNAVAGNGAPGRQLALQLLALPVSLPMAAVTALVPVVRVLEGTAARALCAGAADTGRTGAVRELAVTLAKSWAARRRTSAWFVLHLLLGGIVAGMSLATPPAAVLLALSSIKALGHPGLESIHRAFGGQLPSGLLLGPALLLLLLAVNAGSGALLARCAPVLLGPTPAERLAAVERRAAELAQRNRLARELHDSVGHALSAVTIQAAAAAKVLHSEPEFAAQALRAIEETTRAAVAELDTVLGLLREEPTAGTTGAGAGTGPTLDELGTLIRQMGLAGVRVESHAGSGLGDLPSELSQEAYRIVQEGLTNVLRHAGPVSARLRLELSDGRLEIDLANPLGANRPSRPGGGRGLRGVAERVEARRGGFLAGPQADGTWRLSVRLPLPALPAESAPTDESAPKDASTPGESKPGEQRVVQGLEEHQGGRA